MCLASTCLYALPATSGHDPGGMSDALLGDVFSHLGEGISQLTNSLWCEVAAVEATELALADVWRFLWPYKDTASPSHHCLRTPLQDPPVMLITGQYQIGCMLLGR